MSEPEIEKVKAVLDAFNEADHDRLIGLVVDDVEVQRLGGLETLRGQEALRDWLAPDAIEFQRGEAVEFRQIGDRTLVTCNWRVRGAGSGVEVESTVFILVALREGKLARLEVYQDGDEALEAALREDNSPKNVEVVRRSFEAIDRWDIDALLEVYDQDVHFLPLTGTRVESGGYSGHDGVRDYFEEISDVWSEMHPYANEFRIAGSDVVVLGGCAVRGIGSGAETDTPMAWVMTVRDGKVTSHRGFRTRSEALEAVGLSE